MTNSGLSDLLRPTFGSVDKMLSSNSHKRALRVVVEELLHSSIDVMIKFDDLTAFLQTLREQNPTSKL